MDGTIDNFLRQLELRPGATEEAITALQKSIGMALPGDYLDFLRRSDGGIGHGPDLFVVLDQASEVAATTVGYGTSEYAPGLAVFGSDGFGNVLGIDTRSHDPRDMDYVILDACNIGWAEVWHRTGSLICLLEYLAQAPKNGAG